MAVLSSSMLPCLVVVVVWCGDGIYSLVVLVVMVLVIMVVIRATDDGDYVMMIMYKNTNDINLFDNGDNYRMCVAECLLGLETSCVI